jgi:deazaflavin-dependent oxidoreductase (nitroreductase family)
MSSEQPPPQRPQVPQDMKAFNAELIQEYRATGGKLTGPRAGMNPLLLTTTGAKSFAERTVVLGFRPYGNAFAVIASNNGADKPPYWFTNLQANPVATVEVGGESFKAKSRVAEGAERAELAKLIDYLERQQALTSRVIPIVVLERL